MSIIRHKRSDIAGRVPTTTQIDTGEIAINTHDGKMYFTRDKDGTISVREVGLAERTDNVLYVSKTGSDTDNNGTTLAEAFATINQALSVAQPGTTIFLKSGDHVLDNSAGGVNIPERVAIVGDNLRTTNIRPSVSTNDLFYVNNGSHFTGVTFRDYVSPSAAVSFNPDGSAGEIRTSPYVQNCSSITTTGTGMRIDGNHCSGLRSMVADAYTNINFGGIGVHLLNRGYAQLVSQFTISCEDGILAENGGFCSLTNSNCSFGTYGLRATGTSGVIYTATSSGLARATTSVIELKDVTERPKYGDAIKFAGIDKYHTVENTSGLFVTEEIENIVYPAAPGSTVNELNASQQLQNNRTFASEKTVRYIEENYPEIEYNIGKCKRDIHYIVDALTHDILYGGNTATLSVAQAYFVGAVSQLPADQVTATINSYEYLKTLLGQIVQELAMGQNTDAAAASQTETNRVEALVDIIIDVITAGNLDNLPAVVDPDFTGVDLTDYNTILAAKATLQADVITYINTTYPALDYDEAKCSRDVGLIVDAVIRDLALGTDYNSTLAGASYQRANASVVVNEQEAETVDAINYLRDQINALAIDPATQSIVTTSISTITTIIVDGDTATLTLLESLDQDIVDSTTMEFFQRSLIVASSITFEYIGTGTEVFYNTPRTGAIPIQANEIVFDDNNAGQVYFTSTDHKGDFRIGSELLINRDAGIIEGVTFDRSLFAVLTPYILAIEG